MKIKRFKNLWAMGLLLFGAILIALYIAKILFPQFVIELAELPKIVEFGTWIDSNKWSFYLFNGITSFATLYLYVCAVCRIKTLDLIECIVIIVFIIIYAFVQEFFSSQTFTYNISLYFILPFIVCRKRNIENYKIFYSSCICFLITAFGQSLSLEIRGISTLISYPNTATFFILVIDGTIWHILLYLYFNYKGDKNNG